MNNDLKLAEVRLANIRKLLKEHGMIRVEELCKDLNVSAATVRRDLAELHSRGLAQRVHGGAVYIAGILDEPVFDDKTSIAGKQKQYIAKLALKLIKPNDSIFLDGGSTVLALARLLSDMPRLTIVTNSLRVASALSGSGPRVIVAGGELRRLSQTFVGAMTAPLLGELCLDKAFMGTIGLSEKEGLTTTDPGEAFTKKLVMSRASKTILLADSTKLGKVSFSRFGNITDIHTLVTDRNANSVFTKRLRKKGLNILT